MPQMNPIWWLSLMILFLSILLLTNTMIYFYKNYYAMNKFYSNKSMGSTPTIWKW